MLAEPMLRAPRPEIVPESITVAPPAPGGASAAKAEPTRPDANTHVHAASSIRISLLLEPYLAEAAPARAAGKWNRSSSAVTFASALSNCTFWRLVEPLGPPSCANGK